MRVQRITLELSDGRTVSAIIPETFGESDAPVSVRAFKVWPGRFDSACKLYADTSEPNTVAPVALAVMPRGEHRK